MASRKRKRLGESSQASGAQEEEEEGIPELVSATFEYTSEHHSAFDGTHHPLLWIDFTAASALFRWRVTGSFARAGLWNLRLCNLLVCQLAGGPLKVLRVCMCACVRVRAYLCVIVRVRVCVCVCVRARVGVGVWGGVGWGIDMRWQTEHGFVIADGLLSPEGLQYLRHEIDKLNGCLSDKCHNEWVMSLHQVIERAAQRVRHGDPVSC